MKIFTREAPRLLNNQIEFTNNVGELEKCDCALLMEGGEMHDNDIRIIDALGITMLGRQNRFDKITQALILEKFKISHPETFFNRSAMRPFNCIQDLDSYCDLENFIVKPITGARGIGVKKMDRNIYKTCIEHPDQIGEVYQKELVEMGKLDYGDIDKDYIKSNFNSCIVQEIINMKKEFRLLLFPNSELIYERLKRNKGDMGNLTSGSIPGNVDSATRKLLKPVIDQLHEILAYYKYPWLSIDLYLDENDKPGVIEFQMEFAYEGFEHANVRNGMKNALEYLVDKIEGKK